MMVWWLPKTSLLKLAAAGFVALAATRAVAAEAPPAATIQAAINQHGAAAVVHELRQQNEWVSVSDQIAAGKRDWVALVPLLAAGADAGPSEELGIDLALALPRDPEAVLHVIDPKMRVIGIERVCGRPFIEDTEPKDYFRRASNAIRSVHAPNLTHKKQECLTVLAQTAARRGG